MTKTVLTCVIQYHDGDAVRIAVAGWDDADPETQSSHIRESVIRIAGLENFRDTIECIRFVELELPVVETIDPASVVVKDVA